MEVYAPFYVKNTKNRLVPAKFLVSPNGQYVSNTNKTLNTINPRNNHYFNADGSEIPNANPGNYLVVERLPQSELRKHREKRVDLLIHQQSTPSKYAT